MFFDYWLVGGMVDLLPLFLLLDKIAGTCPPDTVPVRFKSGCRLEYGPELKQATISPLTVLATQSMLSGSKCAVQTSTDECCADSSLKEFPSNRSLLKFCTSLDPSDRWLFVVWLWVFSFCGLLLGWRMVAWPPEGCMMSLISIKFTESSWNEWSQ